MQYVPTSTMMNNDKIWCYKCNNLWFNNLEFKKQMMNNHGKKIIIDIR